MRSPTQTAILKHGAGGEDCIRRQLLIVMGMMVMVVMMMGVYDNHHLRLRRIGNCETEGEKDSENQLFHVFRMLP